MLNFRQFEVGPDPFGRKFQVLFKYQQNGISIRHADTVDVGFIVTDDTGESVEKVMALRHPDLLLLSKALGRALDDGWCSRLAAMHVKELLETAGDIEKVLVTVPYADLERYAAAIAREEHDEVARRKSAA